MNDTLKVLKLDGNKLQRFGGLALADALQVNTTLEELNLNNTEQASSIFSQNYAGIEVPQTLWTRV